MTTRHDVDLLLDRWLAEGPAELSDRVLDSALDLVEHTQQRRVVRLPWRNRPMLLSTRLAAAAAVVVLVALGGAYLLRSSSAPVAGPSAPPPSALTSIAPTLSPTPSATPAPSASAAPIPTVIPGTSLATGPTKLVAGRTYSTAQFAPAFSIKGQTGWWYLDGGPGSAWFASGPNEPHGPDTDTVGIVVPAIVIQPRGSGGSDALPTDLVGWLQARPDLSLGSAAPVTVGGFHGMAVTGTVNVAVTLNAGVNVLCPAETHPCAQDQPGALGFAPNSAFRIIVLQVRGQSIVIGMQGPNADWSRNARTLDDLVGGLDFPGPGQ